MAPVPAVTSLRPFPGSGAAQNVVITAWMMVVAAKCALKPEAFTRAVPAATPALPGRAAASVFPLNRSICGASCSFCRFFASNRPNA